MEKFAGYIGMAVLALGAIVVEMAVNGLTLFFMWAWFFVPAFGLAALSFPAALGVAATVGFLSIGLDPAKEKYTWEDFGGVFIAQILRSGFVLAAGWVLQLYM